MKLYLLDGIWSKGVPPFVVSLGNIGTLAFSLPMDTSGLVWGSSKLQSELAEFFYV